MFDARVLLLLVVLAGRLAICAPAFAQPADDRPAEDTSTEDVSDPRTHALELYRQSRERYELGDYEGAAALLHRAYALFPEANLLYNLARAYGNLGEFERAIEAYERYLEADPETELRGTIEARIDNYRQALAERRAEARARELERREALERARRAAGDGPDPAPWILAGVGGGVFIAGAILGGLSLDARSEAEADPSFLSAREASDRAVALGWAANGGFAVGGLLMAIGAVWGIVDVVGRSGADSEEPRPGTLAFVVGPGGLTLAW